MPVCVPVRPLITAYQARRRARLLERAHQRLAERQAAPEAARLRAYTGRAGAALSTNIQSAYPGPEPFTRAPMPSARV